MKSRNAVVLCLTSIVLAGAAFAYPDGFVLRGRLERTRSDDDYGHAVGEEMKLDVVVSLYTDAGSPVALWSGRTNVVVSSDGRYQMWVSDAIRRAGTAGGSEPLADALTQGHARSIGLKFAGNDGELDQRTSLSTVPMVHYARNTVNIDDGGLVAGRMSTERMLVGGDVTLGTTVVGTNGIETTEMGDLTLNVNRWETRGTGGLTLRDSDANRVFSPGRTILHSGFTNTNERAEVKKGTELVGPKGSGALIESDRGGVVTVSYGRMMPCVAFFVNPGSTFKMPVDIPKDTAKSTKRTNHGHVCLMEY